MARLIVLLVVPLILACEPRKPAEPKPPIPKVDFTHERSTP
jgi:hypothetical protein